MVVATSKDKTRIVPTQSRSKAEHTPVVATQMLFGRENYKWVFIGIGLILLGMILMMGGAMPSPDVWDDSLIYSHRRITLAPIVILAGLGLQVYAIFK